METGKGKEGNPLAHVLEAIGEPLELIQYNTWNVIVPEGQFLTKVRDLALALVRPCLLPCLLTRTVTCALSADPEGPVAIAAMLAGPKPAAS